MNESTSKARRVYLVRISVYEPTDAGMVFTGEDFQEAIRLAVTDYVRSLGLEVRLASSVEITEGVNLLGEEPTAATPADIETAMLPNLADLAEALRIMAGHSLMLPERRHLAALAASAERWRFRFAARLTMPEERAVFNAAVDEMLRATFRSISIEGGPRG